MNKIILLVIGVVLLLVAVGVFASNNNGHEEICFCHNVNHNPHTICTDEQGQINGHNRHVNNGTDTEGACQVETPSITPSVTPTPSDEPTPTPTPTPEVSEEPKNNDVGDEQDCCPGVDPIEPTPTPVEEEMVFSPTIYKDVVQDQDGNLYVNK